MAEITASLVKELREKTGAGMMDAKSALVETGGDMESAVDWLRKKGLAKAAKKSGRTAAEGLVAIAIENGKGVIVEVNSETDFVARNEEFQVFVKKVTQTALKDAQNLDDLLAAKIDGKSVQDTLTALIAKIGENMSIRRMARLEVKPGVIAGYMHNAVAPNLGKIGVLIALQSSADAGKLQEAGKQIAMHVAAASPQYLSKEAVDSSALDRERDVLSAQAREQGKPEEIIAKMVEGRLRKFYEEVCLLEQVSVVDSETKISKLLENIGKDIGGAVSLVDFARFQLGEGIEKEETDFAAEVAKAVNG